MSILAFDESGVVFAHNGLLVAIGIHHDEKAQIAVFVNVTVSVTTGQDMCWRV